MDASLLSLLLYTFPVLVAMAAVALGRDRLDRPRLTALALSSAGLTCVVLGAGAGSIDPAAAAMGLGAAVVYSAYILISERIVERAAPRALSALVCTGAAVTLTTGSLLLGDLHPGEVSASGWGWLAGIAVISTFGAVSLFFAGLKRVGPTMASILATIEPVVTVALAFVVFGETLTPVQIAGGLLVLSAVPVLARSAPRELAQAVERPGDEPRDPVAARLSQGDEALLGRIQVRSEALQPELGAESARL